MLIKIYPEFHESREEDLQSYIEDKLSTSLYGSGQLETVFDRIDNNSRCLASLLETLVSKKIISLKNIPKFLNTSDYIEKG